MNHSAIAALLLVLTGGSALATTFTLPPAGVDVIGHTQQVTARYEDTLPEIARGYGVGFEEIVLANPSVDPWLPGAGRTIRVPTRYVLPDAPREGIVLNLPEMRLYYFPKSSRGGTPVVMTYPVSIGRMDWKTPLGTTRVLAKVKDPAWYPPKSIREEHAADGETLPKVVPPGPDNPLGRHALRLGIPGYLIHGTNRPRGVGMRVTHGCVRMYPENIEALFDRVPVGTPVHIVNQPIKVGWFADTLFIEVHPVLEEESGTEMEAALNALEEALWVSGYRIGGQELQALLSQPTGIPTPLLTQH